MTVLQLPAFWALLGFEAVRTITTKASTSLLFVAAYSVVEKREKNAMNEIFDYRLACFESKRLAKWYRFFWLCGPTGDGKNKH